MRRSQLHPQKIAANGGFVLVRFPVIRHWFFAAACTKVRFRRCITAQCYHAEGLRWAANTNCATSREGPLCPASRTSRARAANVRFGFRPNSLLRVADASLVPVSGYCNSTRAAAILKVGLRPVSAAGWLRDGRSGDRRALNDRWHRRCTPAGAFGGAARQWRTGHHVALPHPPDSGRGLRLMWPFRKSAETRSSSGGFTMPRPADIIRHLPACGMDTDAAWDAAMISRIWDEDATIVVAKRCSWRSRSASGGWAIRPAQGWHSRTPGRQHVPSSPNPPHSIITSESNDLP